MLSFPMIKDRRVHNVNTHIPKRFDNVNRYLILFYSYSVITYFNA